ncbi:hypothetical protein IM40_09180 [Candidatus Paracaedimonas acanthamoebae]|nr:hypothetical protein IM40_09180 [Candidatus Paracaedimonas acanthamoebae]
MMKKSFTLKALINLFTFILFFSQAKSSSIFDDYLQQIEGEFDHTLSSANKYKVISRPINIEYLQSVKNLQDLDEKQLTTGVSADPLAIRDPSNGKFIRDNYDKTTALSLAISLGKQDLVEKFLMVVPDVNDLALTAWGFRQLYTLAHMALDPSFPKSSQPVPLEIRLAIVDTLFKKWANFNAIVKPNIYANPPLTAGKTHLACFDEVYSLQARALLYGADPTLKGTSFYGIDLGSEWNKFLMETLFKQYIEMIDLRKKTAPTPTVLQHLHDFAHKRGFDLKNLENLVAMGQKNAAQIEKFKSQKTKKAKSKVHHLKTIQQEFEKDFKSEIAKLKKNNPLLN